MHTLGQHLDQWASTHDQRVALVFEDRTVSFSALADAARRCAAALARIGVSKGTRVGILMPNRPDWLYCAFGAWYLGAIVVPINTLLRQSELAQALRHGDVTVLLAAARFLSHDYQAMLTDLAPVVGRNTGAVHVTSFPSLRRIVLQQPRLGPSALDWDHFLAAAQRIPDSWVQHALATVAPSDDAALFFTSGSTGTPKGAVHTHQSLLHAAAAIADCLGVDHDDRTWGYLPFFFTGGLIGMALSTLSRGGAVLLQERFEPGETVRLLERHGCTTFFAWPYQADAIINHPHFDRSRLNIYKGVGANTTWAPALYRPEHRAIGTWGMTETASIASACRFDDPLADRTGSHGRPLSGLDIRIVDPQSGVPVAMDQEGEIIVRGRSLMRTYYKMTPADCFDADGFFHTGDRGRLDAGGRLHFIGRLKDVIKTAGVNVSPAEVEAVLHSHPTVEAAYVVGVPHQTRGENVAAFVIFKASGPDEAALLEHCGRHLASYKVPRHIFIARAAEIPTLGSGKVDRQKLRERARSLASPEG